MEAVQGSRPWHVLAFFALYALPLYFFHLQLISLPYFWDEHGQFIPTALDILRHGWWVTHSAVPNVHPPGVEAYLALWYKIFGYGIPITRIAMLAVAAVGLLLTFLLAIRLSAGIPGAPAFWPPLLLLVSPLFYMQSFMAQLDMPAMVFTILSVWLFLSGKYKEAAAASVALVLTKETGLVTPFAFFVILAGRRDWNRALYFAAPAVALGIWLFALHHVTGYWLGDPGFAHYNIGYSLNPVRVALSLLRRLFYLFVAEFRWIGTLALIIAFRCRYVMRSEEWRVVYAVVLANLIIVTALGGAELERYLLPVLPFFYIASVIALYSLGKWWRAIGIPVFLGGLVFSIFWNPPYPFPYENNYAMVDFVELQRAAAQMADASLGDRVVATAWPFTAALRDPDYGYVQRSHPVVETGDFHPDSIEKIPASKYSVLVTYTRTWAPSNGIISIRFVRNLLSRFYDWQPDISDADCARLGLKQIVTLSNRGQSITIYRR